MLTCIKFGKETVKKSQCIVAEQEKQEELKVKCAQISPLISYSQPKLTIASACEATQILTVLVYDFLVDS